MGNKNVLLYTMYVGTEEAAKVVPQKSNNEL